LQAVQAWLLDVGSALCTPRSTTINARKLQRTKVSSSKEHYRWLLPARMFMYLPTYY
tara:strand:+ start:328 stop:498 length:171 start_codon:yes stop_codon:yes gene_type:complete